MTFKASISHIAFSIQAVGDLNKTLHDSEVRIKREGTCAKQTSSKNHSKNVDMKLKVAENQDKNDSSTMSSLP